MKTGAQLLADINNLHVQPGALAFWWLGQMGYIVKAGGRIFYFDPFLVPYPSRQVPPLLDANTVTNADWVFGSHDHGDHIDPVSLPLIAAASPQARFVCSRVSSKTLRTLGIPADRIVAMDENITQHEGPVTISAIPAQHEFFDRDPELGYPHLCHIVQVDGLTIAHLGDTLRYDGMVARLSKWEIDVMFVPINGRDAARYARNCIGNMTYQEAVDLAGDIRPRLTVPGHYDMFADNSQDPQAFADYMSVKFPKLPFWIGDHGEPIVLEPRA
jgi:L-ascorbate 6-phosphate lactonase